MSHKLDVPHMWKEQMGQVVAKQNELAADAYSTDQSIEELRQAYRTERRFWNEGGPDVAWTRDVTVPTRHGQVRVRHYRDHTDRALPWIVYLHGGGWMIGDVDTHDRITRTLCHLTGAAVLSIDYTLAPEAKFPHQIEQCCDVVTYVHAHADQWGLNAEDFSFAGDSAGANMACALALKLRDEAELPPARTMLLFYGAYGLKDSVTQRLLGGSWDGLTKEDYASYLEAYLRTSEDVDHPLFNVLANDFSVGIGPCFIVGADLDPLYDDSRALAQILSMADVPNVLRTFSGVLHGFLHHSKMLDDSMAALQEAATYFETHNPLMPARITD
ncbi:alpha/beta hydrolase fold domain-containing protein [Schaalia suimastitidis]|uniref:alpha/beta hydrolase fold domain-containing protein n=1 Tax=Schaalia suimastitidis TaxID=121163 RepID=UPI00041041DE|nr:alpha/beta hydrolase fold domain-containing protein [Schaalia suimastitidis]